MCTALPLPLSLPRPPLSLSLLSNNGRHIWRFVQPHSLLCTDLLSNRSVLYPLIGFSSIGHPLAIYWTSDGKKGEDEEEGREGTLLVLLDFKPPAQSEVGAYVSQRKLQLDHSRRQAHWVGPTHRQYGTGGISRILSVVLGSTCCAIVGEDVTEDGASATLLCIPRLPESPDWPSEVSLRGFSTNLDPNALNSLFFIGRPIVNGGNVEPTGQTEKLFFATQQPQNGQFVAIPVCPLSALLPFRPLPIRPSADARHFPPSFPVAVRHFTHCGGRFVMTLFRMTRIGAVRWSLGRLDTFNLTWEGPLMEWEGVAGDEQKDFPEAKFSADGGLLAVAMTTSDQARPKHFNQIGRDQRRISHNFSTLSPVLKLCTYKHCSDVLLASAAALLRAVALRFGPAVPPMLFRPLSHSPIFVSFGHPTEDDQLIDSFLESCFPLKMHKFSCFCCTIWWLAA